ncbi:MAG: hypothetical protein ACE5DN_03430, partial [Flavobacteriales bacterium]
MALANYISELLYEHDCVIVPGFGGFIAGRAPSRIEAAKQRISPPRKELSFNENLRNNDGLLATRIAGDRRITYDEANEFIRKEVDEWKRLLSSKKRVEVDKVGVLYYTGAEMQFEPDTEVNYLLDSFGLQPCYIRPIKRKVEGARARTDRPSVRHSGHKSTKRLLPYAIASIPFILYLLWLPLGTDLFTPSGSFTYSDLNPFVKKKCPVYTMREISATALSETDIGVQRTHLPAQVDSSGIGHLALTFEGDTSVAAGRVIPVRLAEPIRVKVESTYVETNKPKKEYRFYVIGGCFKFLKNAKRLIKKLSSMGYEAVIVDKH